MGDTYEKIYIVVTQLDKMNPASISNSEKKWLQDLPKMLEDNEVPDFPSSHIFVYKESGLNEFRDKVYNLITT